MGKLELQQMVLGPVYTNCYFLKNKEIKIIIKDLKKNKIVYVRDA